MLGNSALIPKESLWALLPMIVYIVMAFRPKAHAGLAALLAVVTGYILTGQTPEMFAKTVTKSLSSMLGVIGLIIMCGAGLGAVMSETGVSHTFVKWIIKYIGVKTQNRAILSVILATTLICGFLGTLSGGCAIIAPILIPVVAAAGLKPSTVAALFQSCGETGLIWGPFTGPTVALLGITGLSYGQMMLWAAIPYGIIWLVVIYFVARHIQKSSAFNEVYEVSSEDKIDITITKREQLTTFLFVLGFLFLVVYSLFSKQGLAYTIFVMVALTLLITLVSGIGFTRGINRFIAGFSSMGGIFFVFIMLDIMLQYINFGHGFEALGDIFLTLAGEGSRSMVVIMGTLVGSFGVNGGAVAQLKVTNDLFIEAVKATHVPVEVWALALICGSRVTTSIYPGPNMLAPMGLARSESLKAMLYGGWAVSMVSILFIVIWALIGMPLVFPL